MIPKLIDEKEIIIAGFSGGEKTSISWEKFDNAENIAELTNAVSDDGFEVRMYSKDGCNIHVGLRVSNEDIPENYEICKLPPSLYAVFEIYTNKDRNKQFEKIDTWLKEHKTDFKSRQFNGDYFVCNFGRIDNAEPVMELWAPLIKNS